MLNIVVRVFVYFYNGYFELINCVRAHPTDDSFLLRFLRVKKFSLPIAQETLERYLLLRHVYGTLMFHNLDIKDTVMDELLHLGYVLLPVSFHNGV